MKGGAASGAWSNPLSASELPKEHVLAREAIQNSTDAQAGNDKVRVSFMRRVLTPDRRDEISKLLKLREGGPVERLEWLGLQPGNLFEQLRLDEDKPSDVLLIEDFATLGLGGRLDVGESDEERFRRLVLVLGLEGDFSDQARGGSFGYGKSVYPGASNVRTVIYYSVFEPSTETEGAYARLFVASFFHTHSIDGISYTGRAWFGVGDGEVWPLVDDAAHEMAGRLGFAVRSPDETGASLMALGSDIDLADLRHGIETYWWPRLVDDDLEIRLFDGDDEMVGPRPRIRPDLRPYIHCYEMIVGRAKANTEGERTGSLGRSAGSERGDVTLGQWGACEIASQEIEDATEEDEGAESRESLQNKVCVMRRPRMAVEYIDTPSQNGEAIVAVFVADEQADSYLRFSEPSSHDKWNHNNPRLAQIENGPRLVRVLLRRLKRQIGDFQKALAPPPPPIPTEPLSALQHLLSDLLGGRGRSKGSPPRRTDDPFVIEIHESRHETDEGSRIASRVALSLKPEALMDELSARAVMRAAVLADDNQASDEQIELAQVRVDGRDIVPSDDGMEVSLSKEASVVIEVMSYPIHPEWQAQISIEVSAPKPPSG